ncbi:MAG: 2-hydroxyglutaryl-CoA dehydratase, D-component [Tenericutes bacterium ADurb.BinA155]|jgi:predicted nucleotide-binding protein (sugar kinase/HSP70/actin superfamily)|nr:MAG: 2-hydroxyglutaryl-CoA dehydratase, D-component [Tenericutes bacterium ADurb.BinA155]
MSYPTLNRKQLKEYTLLVPDMLDLHFGLILDVLNHDGYHTELLHEDPEAVKEEGLRNTNNDACYPALLVIGQFIRALRSGRYDLHKTGLLISQTGGGCRASNYIFLIRKAIAPLFPEVPVVSMNFSGLESNCSIPLTASEILRMAHSVCYADFLTALYDQSKPYESKPGEADQALAKGHALIQEAFTKKNYARRKHYYRALLHLFDELPKPKERKPRVAIVGEIYVKYSATANNHLIDFLVKNGVEVVQPGVLEFCLYCAKNALNDHKKYGLNKKSRLGWALIYKFLLHEVKTQNKILASSGYFYGSTPFKEIEKDAERIINQGVKMGEGWLIPSEMLSYLEHGVPNIVCCQPFGCLPNHIVAKGMMHPLLRLHPEANIAAIDYDPATSYVNQENRLKLMLANIGNNA